MTVPEFIYNQQQAWASERGIKYDQKGYAFSLEDNLFLPLSGETYSEFSAASGDELGRGKRRGKMQALHSSSALVCNVFEYWRTRNVNSIAKACGAPEGMTKMQFERVHYTPLHGRPPHLDVEFSGPRLRPLAIESKFTEPYHEAKERTIEYKYVSQASLWVQLPRCGALVKSIHEESTCFTCLDAPQLLKHILGLTREFGSLGFELVYLWYEMPSQEAQNHRKELEKFKSCIGDEVYFRDMTYQELFESIKRIPSADDKYIHYLAERYFSPLSSEHYKTSLVY